MNIKEEIDRAAPLIDRLNDAIRENPVAAGLIGAGVAWMLFGAKGAGDTATSGTTNVGSKAAAVGNAMVNAGATAVSGVKAGIDDVADTVASLVPDQVNADPSRAAKVLKDVGMAVNDRAEGLASSGREYGAVLQSRLSNSLEKQPLLLGAIGLAIGAGIASTFATTAFESEWVGEKGTAAREKLHAVLDEAKEHGLKVLSEVQDEAARQRLSLDAAKDAAVSVAEKVRNVAQTARDSVVQPFK